MVFTSRSLRWPLAILTMICLSGCATDGATLGDLFTGGPPPLAGSPESSGLVLVDVKLVAPEGEMFDSAGSLLDAHPRLQDIKTDATIKYTDERDGYVLFSNVPPGEYRFMMDAVTRGTFDKSQKYQQNPDLHGNRYTYQQGDVWKGVITVTAGRPVYRGQIVITPDAEGGLFNIGVGLSGDESTLPPAQVELSADQVAEKAGWTDYFLKRYNNSVWAPAVRKHLTEMQ